jgi:hypothetical protein
MVGDVEDREQAIKTIAGVEALVTVLVLRAGS